MVLGPSASPQFFCLQTGTRLLSVHGHKLQRHGDAWCARSGVIPYILHQANGSLFAGHYVYQAITYSSESFISNALRFPSSAAAMAGLLNTTVEWMIEEQNADGTWGVLLSGDGERSPRVVSLLQWHYSHYPSAKTADAINRFVAYLLKPSNSEAFGVRLGILQSGFVGLVFADLLDPWITFSPAA
jgi:hypothetical protein